MSLKDKLLKKCKTVLVNYLNKNDLIANADVVVPYLKELEKHCRILSGRNEQLGFKELLKHKEDLELFLKTKTPKLKLKNNYNEKMEPFNYLSDFELITINRALDAFDWISDGDLNMVACCLKDGCDLIQAGKLIEKYDFWDGFKELDFLDTAVRDYIQSDFWNWKHSYQKQTMKEAKTYESGLKEIISSYEILKDNLSIKDSKKEIKIKI